MAKNFSQFEEDNPVMAILGKAKQEEEQKIEKSAETNITKVQNEKNVSVSEKPAASVIKEPENSSSEPKKILMNISIRETTKKDWKMFFLEHDLSMTQGIETAVEYLKSEVAKGNIKLSKGGITR